MIYHVLNGDALVDRFVTTSIDGEIIVCRECLVEGPTDGTTMEDFFRQRRDYLCDTAEDVKYYNEQVAPEFEKIMGMTDSPEINLWFGYDLFCRANMLFILSLLQKARTDNKVFVVYPSHLTAAERWKDFGGASPSDLLTCFKRRLRLSAADISFVAECWLAFKNNDFDSLLNLAEKASHAFPYLKEVFIAHIERFPSKNELSRPERTIIEIIKENNKQDFPFVFSEFWKREGIYGFGDSQLRQVYDKVIKSKS